MTRSTVRSFSIVAAMALSSLLSFAGDKPATAQDASEPAKTEQICQVYPEYSCVEVPTVYGYQSAKQAKQQKALARKAKAAQKNSPASASNSAVSTGTPQTGNGTE